MPSWHSRIGALFGVIVPVLNEACQTLSTNSHFGILWHFSSNLATKNIWPDSPQLVHSECEKIREIPWGIGRENGKYMGGARAFFEDTHPYHTKYISLDRSSWVESEYTKNEAIPLSMGREIEQNVGGGGVPLTGMRLYPTKYISPESSRRVDSKCAKIEVIPCGIARDMQRNIGGEGENMVRSCTCTCSPPMKCISPDRSQWVESEYSNNEVIPVGMNRGMRQHVGGRRRTWSYLVYTHITSVQSVYH